jgi:transcriptional regulator with XRE-family HTH domain
MKTYNIIGPKIRRPRHLNGLSQDALATTLQLLRMANATRGKISKIESRLVWGSNQNLVHFSRRSEQFV